MLKAYNSHYLASYKGLRGIEGFLFSYLEKVLTKLRGLTGMRGDLRIFERHSGYAVVLFYIVVIYLSNFSIKIDISVYHCLDDINKS